MEGQSFQDLGGDCNKGSSSYHHLFLVSWFAFVKFPFLSSRHLSVYTAVPALYSLHPAGMWLRVMCINALTFSTFSSSPLSCCHCYFTWAFLPVFWGSKFQEKYHGTLRKGASFTFGFPFRCTAAHWTVQFSSPQNSPAS